AIASQSPRCVRRRGPGRTFVAAEHHEAATLVRILAHETAKFGAIGRAKREGLTRILALDGSDDARRPPREATIRRDGLEHLQWRAARTIGAFVIKPDVVPVLQADDTAERHHAGQAERRHLAPGGTVVFADDARHRRAR